LFGTDSDQNRMLEEIPRSGADSLPLIKPLRRMRTLCGQTQTQVWSESSVNEHNLYFARPAIVGLTSGRNYLGSAESPTSDFFQVWLKSSCSGDVVSPQCSPQVIWAPRPPSLYGRRLSRTVLAVVPARLAKICVLSKYLRPHIFSPFPGEKSKT
jgi:hypothetical protein